MSRTPFRSLAPLARSLTAVLLLALSFAGLLAGPAHAATTGTPVLTGAQQRAVLDSIDDACGDSWCEGDLRYDFRTFTCDRVHRTCTLGMRLAPYTDGTPHWYWRSGTVHGFTRFGQMVTTSQDGQHALTPAFYDAVNVLINTFGESLPGGDRPAQKA